MAASYTSLLIVCLLISGAIISGSAGGDHSLSWMVMTAGKGRKCEESVEECSRGGEFDMDTEINRRILATTQYISYSALQRNSVPCSQRGASYYNCQPGAQANPYSRGCSAITRCRS